MRAGAAVGGAVPAAGEAVELRHTGAHPVEDGHFGLQNVAAAVEREAVVAFPLRGDNIGSKDEDTVDGRFAPVGNYDKVVEDDAVAGIADVEAYGLVVRLAIECVAVVEIGQLLGRDGVVVP